MASSTDVETSETARDDAPNAERQTPGANKRQTPNAERRLMLMATFVNRKNADRALDVVRERDGYSEDDVSVLRSDVTREKYFGDDRHEHVEVHMANKVPEGASTGALIGAIIGALAGAFGVVAVENAIGIPALGIALMKGLSSILAGIGTLGTLGGLIGGHAVFIKYAFGASLAPHTPRLLLSIGLVLFGFQLLMFGFLSEMLTKVYYRERIPYRVDRIES